MNFLKINDLKKETKINNSDWKEIQEMIKTNLDRL